MVADTSLLSTLNLLFDPGDTIEIRCVSERQTINGYYRDFTLLARDAASLNASDGPGENVYLCLNPAKPSLYARRADKVAAAGRGSAVKDSQVTCRRWLLVDIDVVRESGISATDAEKQGAQEMVGAVYEWLVAQWGKGCLVVADSGNGYHILIRLQDLPADEETRRACERFLSMLAARFTSANVKVDQATFNAGRIAPCYGTIKRKGSDIPERPHRQSKLLSVPKQLCAVSLEALVGLAGEGPANGQPKQVLPANGVDIPALLQAREVAYTQDDAYQTQSGETATRFELDVCPFDKSHTDRSAIIIQWPSNGAVSFMCQHDGCKGKDWPALQKLWELPPASSGISAADITFSAKSVSFLSAPTVGLSFTQGVDVMFEPVSWLWQDCIVRGGVNLFAGRGGIGKTFFLCDLVARITNESLLSPLGTPLDHGRVLYATGEDHIGKIIAPRMRQHGCNMANIEYIKGVPTERYMMPLDVVAHCGLLHEALRQRPDTVALVLDPITCFQGLSDGNKAVDVRRFCSALNDLAEEFNIGVLGVHHFRKGKREVAGDAISGSHAYRDAARAVWVFVEDPEEPGRCLMVADKFNWSEHRPSGLAYRIQGGQVIYEPTPLDLTSDELFTHGIATQLDIACAWLRARLVSGPQLISNIRLAAAVEGIADRTLDRAKTKAGIIPVRDGTAQQWSLPLVAEVYK